MYEGGMEKIAKLFTLETFVVYGMCFVCTCNWWFFGWICIG